MGKTNLLESLHVGTQAFSPRTRVESDLVRFGARAARVSLGGSEAETPIETEVVVSRGEGKQIRLNGASLRRADELRSRITTLVFVPDRLAVVKGGPLVRRAYFDRALGRLYPARAALPGDYTKALAQRNEALRRARAGVSSEAAVEPWTQRVAALGSDLDAARAELVALLTAPFRERASSLGLAHASIRYEPRPLLVEALAARLEGDMARGVTSLGPHLRDIELTAEGRDLRSFGSQGEQRTAVLALVLAEADLVTARRTVSPLLLLDDVRSELDVVRRSAPLAALPTPGQTVLTVTTEAALPQGAAARDLLVRVMAARAERA